MAFVVGNLSIPSDQQLNHSGGSGNNCGDQGCIHRDEDQPDGSLGIRSNVVIMMPESIVAFLFK
ncbi:MAG: hypothetical protein PVG70_20470 [Desulfobacterales bacterium]